MILHIRHNLKFDLAFDVSYVRQEQKSIADNEVFQHDALVIC